MYKRQGQDCETICGLLESIRGKLDDDGGEYAGQVMGYLNDATGRLCDWGYLRTVEEKVEAAMRDFDYAAEGCALDTQTPGRVTYFYFNPGQYFKYIRPVKRLDK